MPKIIKNYKVNKKTGKVELLDYEHVFVDMPICQVDMDYEYDEPYVYQGVCYEKREIFSKNKEVRLRVAPDGRTLIEDPNGQILTLLPKEFNDYKHLQLINGQVMLVEEEPEIEKKENEPKELRESEDS